MATADVALPSVPPTLRSRPIIRDKLRSSTLVPQKAFDPERHLCFDKEPKVLNLKDIGLPEVGISPVALSEPFPMFSEEAIQHMRSEIFTQEVWDRCLFSSDFAGCQLRGHCPKFAPFMHQAWTNPKTLSIVSKLAGIDLVPVFDYEIGNINVSVNDQGTAKKTSDNDSDDVPVTKWHYDSYPFVCIVMMSDTSNMVGGETAVKTGSGQVMKVRGPQMGCATVMQGRHISHQALAALGGGERITMVTAFRPRDPSVYHTSVLTTIRPISDLSETYFQWTKYRAEVLQHRLQAMLKALEDDYSAGKRTSTSRIKNFLKEQEEWIAASEREIV